MKIQLSKFANVLAKKGTTTTIDQVVEQIAEPQKKVLVAIERVRALVAAGKIDEAGAVKKTLPAVTFSGVFAARKKSALLAHSGLVVLDFDHLEESAVARLAAFADKLPAVLRFISPSGAGVKVGVMVSPVPKTPEEHERAFRHVEGICKEAGFVPDKSGRDVCRLCFLSYDPDVKWNPEAGVIEIPRETDTEQSGPSGTEKVAAGGGVEFGTAVVGVKLVDGLPEAPANAHLVNARAHREYLLSQFGPPYQVTRFDGEQATGFRINERFMAARLVAEGHFIRCPDAEKFYSYSRADGLWKPLSEEMLGAAAGRVIDGELRMGGAANLVPMVTGKMQREVVSHCRGFAEERGFFANRPELIVCQNGAVRVTADGAELVPWSLAHRARTAIPVSYDPKAECPETQSNLIDLNFSPEDSEVLWKYLGLVLLGKNLIQRLLLIHGNQGGTGKSILVNLATLLAGGNVAQLRPHLLSDRFETSRYVGKSLLVAPDVSSNFLSSQSAQAVKTLVGGDMLQHEGKHQGDAPTIKAEFPVIASSNLDIFVYSDTDVSAWRRRLIWLETSGNVPKKKIPDYETHLWRNESPGIFRRAVAGLVALHQDIRDVGDIRLSPKQERFVDVLLGQSNSVRTFCDDALVYGRGHDVGKAELHERYFAFCEGRGWKPAPDFAEKIKRTLAERHVLESSSVQRDGRAVKGYRGAALLEQKE
jgi:phage/plasmid-associated DNA primase